MRRAIILHGTMGSPQGNWFLWLSKQLQNRGLEIWLPQLPNSNNPSLREWKEFVINECPFEIDSNTMLIGHSSGAICATILAQLLQNVGAVIGVSVFCDNSLDWDPNSRLFDIEFDWPKLRQISKKILYIHSDDDPYVPLEKAEFVARESGAELLLWPNQGHFNLEKDQKYSEFPKLLNELILRKLA